MDWTFDIKEKKTLNDILEKMWIKSIMRLLK